MKCSEVEVRLDDYIDGTLPESERSMVTEHAARCSRCNADLQSIEALIRQAAALPESVAPDRDLWPMIAESIEPSSKATIVHHDFRRTTAETKRWKRALIHGSHPYWRGLAAAAVVVIAVGSFWFASRTTVPAWSVEKVEGAPLVDNERVTNSGQLHIGDWLETDNSSRARLNIGVIGEVDVEPNTRLRLVQANLTDHRIALQRGTIHATIWAPPRLFFVETPSALAVDLGCAYTLVVDADGASFLHVTAGYVSLEFQGRESIIPAGAMCATRPGRGPGTPFLEDASEDLRAALLQYDFERGGSDHLGTVLAKSRRADALTLWHLLNSVDDHDRPRVYDKLAAVAPPPSSVTREGILDRNQEMLDRWREELDLGTAVWWQVWKKH